jgi:hypothetical protein
MPRVLHAWPSIRFRQTPQVGKFARQWYAAFHALQTRVFEALKGQLLAFDSLPPAPNPQMPELLYSRLACG